MNLIEEFQHTCHDCLHDPSHQMAKHINGVLAFLVVLSVTVIPLHFLGNDFGNLQPNLQLFDKIVVTIFTLEYFLRLWSAPTPIRYAFSWWGLIDLVAIAPFYFGEMGLLAHPEIFMLLRILRLFKLGQIFETERTAIRRGTQNKHGAFKTFPNENILYVAQKHWVTFIGSLSFCLFVMSAALLSLVFLIPISLTLGLFVGSMLLILAAVMFTKLWLDFNYDLIYITDKRLIWQERELFGAITNEVSYAAISNVKPNDTSFWHWLFKFGDIEIETAAENGNMTFKSARKPRLAVQFISENRMRNPGSVRNQGSQA